MSLKTRLRIAILALVTIVVLGLSALYLYDFTGAAIDAAAYRADLITKQVKDYLTERVQEMEERRATQPATAEALHQDWVDIVRTDPAIPTMLERTTANADLVLNIRIVGRDGHILAASSPHLRGLPPGGERPFAEIEGRNPFLNFWDVEFRDEYYTETLSLGVDGEDQPLFRITSVIPSALLRDGLRKPLQKFGFALLCALAVSLGLGLLLPVLILHPLERLSSRIDSIRSGEQAVAEAAPPEAKEFAEVQSKLDLLGQQFRGAQENATSLRSNVQELLRRLEEAVLIFDGSGRVTMAGEAAHRMLGKAPGAMLGKHMGEVFPLSSALGAVIRTAVQGHEPVRNRVVMLDRGGAGKLRLLMNVEMLGDQATPGEMRTLVTLRDADLRRQLELQLDLSTRLTAIGRLTGGVAHEIKNPLNAMALHLEVLKSKLEPDDPEIGVISKEIKRLDHVVKTFLNFSRPVEMVNQPVDLSAVTKEIAGLVGVEAQAKGVKLETDLDRPEWLNGDPDLLRQAVLNLALNAIEAMPGGGTLRLRTGEAEGDCLLEVADTGSGIPREIQDKIFNLYFSTKKQGSGIGLAMTFRVVHLHRGNISVSSEAGAGAAFHLRFPALSVYEEELARRAHR